MRWGESQINVYFENLGLSFKLKLLTNIGLLSIIFLLNYILLALESQLHEMEISVWNLEKNLYICPVLFASTFSPKSVVGSFKIHQPLFQYSLFFVFSTYPILVKLFLSPRVSHIIILNVNSENFQLFWGTYLRFKLPSH